MTCRENNLPIQWESSPLRTVGLGTLEPLAVIQAVRKLPVLLSHRKQLLADMLDRLSFRHAAEFVGFLFVGTGTIPAPTGYYSRPYYRPYWAVTPGTRSARQHP
jgi:hypothetical protein